MSDHPTEVTGFVGRSVRSINGDAFVSGRATYAADVSFPGQLYAHFLRSPYASAKIRSVDISGALKVSGVILAMDGEGAAEHLDPIPHYLNPAVFGGNYADVRCLALGHAWHYGQPVAVVVATDKRTARYAASKIRVDYEPQTPVVDAESALQADAPSVVPGWSANQVMQIPFVGGDVEKAFADADRVIETRISIHRQSTQPIETRSYNAVWEPLDQGITLYASAQNPHPMRHVLSKALRMPENQLRIIAPAVGGAFGLKMHGHPEEPLLCLLAKLTRGAVKWVEDREECLLVGGREQVHDIEIAVRNDGRILGLRDRFVANTGAPSACPGWGMAFLTGLTMPGPYDIPNIDVLMTAATTNKAPWNASRGYGKEATAIALELAMDKVAAELGIDPAELRFRNFIRKDDFPKKSPTGLILDSGDYEGAVRKVLDLIDYPALRKEQAALRKQGRYLGIGIAYELTPEGGAIPGTMVAGYDTSTVKVDPGGSVLLFTGVTSPGTGNQTGIAQIVADELGVEFERIRVKQGDTAGPYGFGNYSGRSTIVGGGSAALAAAEVRDKMIKVAAGLMEVPEDTVSLAAARFTSTAKPDAELGFEEVAYAAYTRAYDVAACIELPLEATRTFKPGLISHTPDENGKINPYPSYSNAAYAAVLEVDIETGKVSFRKFAIAHDCGRVINPILVEGQACGAASFGVGGMLGEEIVYDERGRQVTGSFVDYMMPRALDMPPIAVAHHDSPNPVTYMGLKGAGEAGVGGSSAAVVNGINDALAPFNVRIHDLPASAPKVWNALREARETQRKGREDAA